MGQTPITKVTINVFSTGKSRFYVPNGKELFISVQWPYSTILTDGFRKTGALGKEWRHGQRIRVSAFSLLYDSRDFLTNAYRGYYLRIDQRFSPPPSFGNNMLSAVRN